MASRLLRAFATTTVAPWICMVALAIDGAAAQSLQILERPSMQLSLPAGVDTALTLADGSILLGGSFDLVQRGLREGLARLDPNGALDRTLDPQCRDTRELVRFTVSRCRIQALLALPDGSVLVGGAFTSIGGLARVGLARLRPDGQVDPGWAAVQLAPERIVELDLTTAGVVVGVRNGNQREHYRISPVTGAIDGAFPPIAHLQGWLVDIRGRSFAWRDGSTGLVRLAPGESAVDSNWSSGLPAGFTITSLVYHAGVDRLFATAYRFLPDGSGGLTSEFRVVRFDPQATVGYDAAWSIDFSGSAFGGNARLSSISGLFAGADHRLYLSPAFGGAPPGGIVAVDAASGRVLSGVSPGGGTSDQYRALADAGGGRLLVAAADPDAVGSVSPGGSALARLQPDLSLDAGFAPRVRFVGNALGAIVAADGAVVVHGEFTRVDDQRIAYLFRLRPDLTLDQTWIPFSAAASADLRTPTNSFWAPAVDAAGRVYLSRSTFGGIFPPAIDLVYFQRLDRDTGHSDSTWSWTGIGTVLNAAFDPEGHLYTGQAGGLSACAFGAGMLARLRIDSPCSADPDWRPLLSGFNVGRVVPDDEGRIYALGSFTGTATGGNPVHNAARIPTASPAIIDPTWRPQPADASGKPAFVGDIALFGTSVYASGSFARIAGKPWRGIARLSKDNATLDSSWNAGDARIAHALAVDRYGLLYSIDQAQPFGPRTRVVLRDTDGSGLPLASIVVQGPQPDAVDVAALPDGGALVVGRFAIADSRVRTGLMAVGPRSLDLFSDSFEPSPEARP